jgi:lipopolysaccharide transport system permease protein
MLRPLLSATWDYRGFIRSSVVNEFRARLARSRFGTAWVILQPLAQAFIFATVLSNVLAARLPGVEGDYAYVVYLMSGILCWNLFAEIVQRCVTVFIDNGSLLRKMHFPRIALPVIVTGSALVSNVALLGVMAAVFPFLGFPPTVQWIWLPLLLAITIALATGLGLLVGTLNVFARDVGQVMNIVLQFWFWITPIVYPVSIVPEAFRVTLAINPVVPLVRSYHDVIVYGRAPASDLWTTVAVAAVLLCLSLFVFRRASAELVDAL